MEMLVSFSSCLIFPLYSFNFHVVLEGGLFLPVILLLVTKLKASESEFFHLGMSFSEIPCCMYDSKLELWTSSFLICCCRYSPLHWVLMISTIIYCCGYDPSLQSYMCTCSLSIRLFKNLPLRGKLYEILILDWMKT